MEPYWWRGSQQEGPNLIRSFPRLETFTLVVTSSNWDDSGEDILMEVAKKHTMAQLQAEQGRYPEWRMPKVHFHYRKSKINWGIRSIAKSLLPENRSDTELLYEWAKEID